MKTAAAVFLPTQRTQIYIGEREGGDEIVASPLLFTSSTMLLPFRQRKHHVFVLCVLFLSLLSTQGHKDCGQEEPSMETRMDAQLAEIEMFGKTVSQMSVEEFSLVHSDSLTGTSSLLPQEGVVQSDNYVVGGILLVLLLKFATVLADLFAFNPPDASQQTAPYRLVDVPIVYHVLPQQNCGHKGSPAMSLEQREYTTMMTNRLYNIWDRMTKKSVQFIHFVSNETIVHDDLVYEGDCSTLHRNKAMMRRIVDSAVEYEFKMHVIVCEFTDISGRATFPVRANVVNPYHNAIVVDYRALACYDDNWNYICENKQRARWWRSRSTVVAHELGHSYGLSHTFEGGCDGGDDVADTPAQTSDSVFGCPGLLPYDKDRDLFSSSITEDAISICQSPACCILEEGQSECPLYHENSDIREPILQNEVNHPGCCPDHTPLDTCGNHAGVDPANNVMSYSPDFCMFELTAGQMARMMAMVRKYKFYLYCNYATVQDDVRCLNIPCASTATSPNCVSNS